MIAPFDPALSLALDAVIDEIETLGWSAERQARKVLLKYHALGSSTP